MVVDAALIAFAVARRGELADGLGQRRLVGQQLGQPGLAPAVTALARGQHHFQGQVFAPVELRRFGRRGGIPVGLQGGQFRVVHGLEILGADQVQEQFAVARQQGQVQLLVAHAEAVAAQADDGAVAFVQLGAVLQRAKRLVAQVLDAAVDVVGLDRVMQLLAQALGQLLELADQRIACKKGMQRVGAGEFFGALGQALHDAQGRVQHALRLALALVLQRLAARLEALQHLLALGHDVAEELLVLAEAAFDFLQLHQQARQLLVAFLGRLRQAQGADDALREQRQLGGELGHVLGAAQARPALLGACTHLVQARVDGRDAIHHLGALRGVVDGQAAHELGQHVQRGRHVGHARQRLVDLRHRGCRLRGLVQCLQLVGIGLHGLVGGNEGGRALGDSGLGLVDALRHGVDGGLVHIAQVARGHELAAQLAQLGERVHVLANAFPVGQPQCLEQLAVAAGNLAHGLGRGVADALDLFVLVDDRITRGDDAQQGLVHALELRRAQPVVALEQAARCVDQALVARQRDLGGRDFLAHAVQVGDAADQLGIADAAQEAVALRLACRIVVRGEGRAPDLHGVHARGLVALGREDDDAPVVHARIAVADDGRLQRALDQVVLEQRHAPALGLVEHVEHILAVGRADAAPVAHALHVLLERAVLAALQVVAAGEDDAVVLRQLDAGRADGIHAQHLARQGVEDQVAPLLFAVGQDLQQDQAADGGVLEHGVVQRLVLLLHGLAVDAQSVVGVVLDLDGQRAAQGLDEDLVQHVDVRVAPLHQLLAPGALPLEVMRCGQLDVALAPVVYVADGLAIDGHGPAEYAHIGQALANLKARQQLAVAHGQLHQPGVLVVGVQLLEVLHEALYAQKAVLEIDRRDLVALLSLVQAVQHEHVFHARGLLQAHEDVVAKQQVAADLGDVAAQAVVFGAHAHAPDDFHLAAAEFLQPLLVELACQRLQRLPLAVKALGQHFVGAAAGDCLVHGRGRGVGGQGL